MNDAVAFLERWTDEHVSPVSAALVSEQAVRLSEKCLADAEEAGFSGEQIEEAAQEINDGYDLISYIEAALKADDLGEADEDDEDS